jgi:hypothetical protein
MSHNVGNPGKSLAGKHGMRKIDPAPAIFTAFPAGISEIASSDDGIALTMLANFFDGTVVAPASPVNIGTAHRIPKSKFVVLREMESTPTSSITLFKIGIADLNATGEPTACNPLHKTSLAIINFTDHHYSRETEKKNFTRQDLYTPFEKFKPNDFYFITTPLLHLENFNRLKLGWSSDIWCVDYFY